MSSEKENNTHECVLWCFSSKLKTASIENETCVFMIELNIMKIELGFRKVQNITCGKSWKERSLQIDKLNIVIMRHAIQLHPVPLFTSLDTFLEQIPQITWMNSGKNAPTLMSLHLQFYDIYTKIQSKIVKNYPTNHLTY